jgi:hypothetical protein
MSNDTLQPFCLQTIYPFVRWSPQRPVFVSLRLSLGLFVSKFALGSLVAAVTLTLSTSTTADSGS